jgi:hypothetical protein
MAVQVYNICDRRTSDLSFVLTKSFPSVKEARDFIEGKIKNSDLVTKRMFSEIEIIDGDEFNKAIDKNNKSEKEEKSAQKIVSDEFQLFYEKMEEKYKDNEMVLKVLSEVRDS